MALKNGHYEIGLPWKEEEKVYPLSKQSAHGVQASHPTAPSPNEQRRATRSIYNSDAKVYKCRACRTSTEEQPSQEDMVFATPSCHKSNVAREGPRGV